MKIYKGTRKEWIDFICSPNNVWRYLYTRGNVTRKDLTLNNSPILEDFIMKLKNDVDIQFISKLYFFTQTDFVKFYSTPLLQLVKSVNKGTIRQTDISRWGVKGNIVWPQTISHRNSGKIDNSSYIVRNVHKSNNLPENRLLKMFVHDIRNVVYDINKIVGTGNLISEFNELKNISDRILKEPTIRDLPREIKISSKMRHRAKRHRDWRYGKVLGLREEFERVCYQNKWESVLQLLQGGWFSPIDDDDLFELYTLAMVLDIIKNELNFSEPKEYGLIRSKRKYVARFVRAADDVSAYIYFDQSPKEIFDYQSEYKHIIDSYNGITGKEHRPDIIINFVHKNGLQKRLIIEVKKTSNKEYTRESIYKVIAYLRDFKGLWDNNTVQVPKALIVFPYDITPKNENIIMDEIVLTAAKDRKRITELIRNASQ